MLGTVIESVKTTSMENVSTEGFDKNKEHYFSCKDKTKKKIISCIKTYTIALVKIQKNKIYSPLCQTYSPTVG